MSKFINDAIMEDKGFSSEMSIQQIPIDKIKPDESQVRLNFNEERLKELRDSIVQSGIQNPIHVRLDKGEYIILTGERRYRASKMASLSHIPCIVHEKKLSEKEIKALQLIENLQREDLGVIETAKGFESLASYGMKQREMAKSLGISEGNISKYRMVLKKLPKAWLDKVEECTIKGENLSIKELYNVAKEKNANKKKAIFSKIIKESEEKIQELLEKEKKPEVEEKEVEVFEVDIDKLWEILKKVAKKDKNELIKYIPKNKIKKLLEEYPE